LTTSALTDFIHFTGGVEVVGCTGGHGHVYPFGGEDTIEGTKILWQFMKSHPMQ